MEPVHFYFSKAQSFTVERVNTSTVWPKYFDRINEVVVLTGVRSNYGTDDFKTSVP
jgi:hypothetical protein